MGPLAGVRVIELAGIGAAPYAGMMLADMGAQVVRIEQPNATLSGTAPPGATTAPLVRSRRLLTLDLKTPLGLEAVLALAEKSDVLIEPYRPGVAERLGMGPDACFARNPKLVYGRMTGWGQTGPLAASAGHDLNYIGLTGLLHQIGPKGGKPVVPLNVIGDFGGGGLLLAFGIACALFETRNSGKGQVVDAAMIDGASSFMAMFFGLRLQGRFDDETGTSILGGAAPYYDVYEAADGKCLAIAPIEPRFYRTFVATLGLDEERWLPAGFPALDSNVRTREWPALKEELSCLLKTRPRDEWLTLFADHDACVSPVLTLAEATQHPHHRARATFIDVEGVQQNAPAPRFSRTNPSPPRAPDASGSDTLHTLREWGVDELLIERIRGAQPRSLDRSNA